MEREHNKHIYDKTASELAENGFHFSAKQCRKKVENLAQSYRKVNKDILLTYKSV